MSGISMTLTEDNQFSVASRIIEQVSGKKVNFLIKSFELGTPKPTITKFCSRELGGGAFLLNGKQVRIPFSPAKAIAWDLNVEVVRVKFEQNGDILLSRVFSAGQKSKILLVTTNPI